MSYEMAARVCGVQLMGASENTNQVASAFDGPGVTVLWGKPPDNQASVFVKGMLTIAAFTHCVA